MKIKKNYKLWGLVFVCFVGVWIWRATTVYQHKAAPIDTEVIKKFPEVKRGTPHPPPPPLGVPSAPITSPKEPVDIWGWIVKIGGALSGLKTLLDIIDKLKSKAPKSITVPVDIPEGSKVTITIIIEKLAKLMLSPIRFFKR